MPISLFVFAQEDLYSDQKKSEDCKFFSKYSENIYCLPEDQVKKIDPSTLQPHIERLSKRILAEEQRLDKLKSKN